MHIKAKGARLVAYWWRLYNFVVIQNGDRLEVHMFVCVVVYIHQWGGYGSVVDIEQRYWQGGITSLFIGMVGMLPYFVKHGGG